MYPFNTHVCCRHIEDNVGGGGSTESRSCSPILVKEHLRHVDLEMRKPDFVSCNKKVHVSRQSDQHLYLLTAKYNS